MAKKVETAGTKLPSSLYEKMEKEVESGDYMNVSDFIRQAVREKIKGDGETS